MKTSLLLCCVLALTHQLPLPATDNLPDLARMALENDPTNAAAAITQLRTAGPSGLDALMTHVSPEMTQMKSDPGHPPLHWEHIRTALDQVAAQRDAWTSGLYWHTSAESAQQEAALTGKPVLSLRLLGNLDEEYSCANSRFFRTALYANQEVSKYLKDHFVLHWESVRPVPKITIDYGDGRILERTITGNSAHYILDAQGRVLDALPGLYGPKAFMNGLEKVRIVAISLKDLPEIQRRQRLVSYHDREMRSIQTAWQNDLTRLGLWKEETKTETIPGPPQSLTQQLGKTMSAIPTMFQARSRVVSKSTIEVNDVRMIHGITRRDEKLKASTDAEVWRKIASLHADESRLDAGSRTLAATKMPRADVAGELSISKSEGENPVLKAIRNFEDSMAEDTVRNEYLFHTQIHRWLITDPSLEKVSRLNDKVYAELFLTPRSDPWLGLRPEGVYLGLEGEGLTQK